MEGKKIVLGITGSIAAYKAAVLTRALIKKGAEVQIVITPAGKEFITPITLSALTSKPVISEFFAQRDVIPQIVFEVRECNAALQYVALRFGVSVLPQVPAMENEKVAVIPIQDEEQAFVRTVYFSWLKNRPLSPAARRSGTISPATTPPFK